MNLQPTDYTIYQNIERHFIMSRGKLYLVSFAESPQHPCAKLRPSVKASRVKYNSAIFRAMLIEVSAEQFA